MKFKDVKNKKSLNEIKVKEVDIRSDFGIKDLGVSLPNLKTILGNLVLIANHNKQYKLTQTAQDLIYQLEYAKYIK